METQDSTKAPETTPNEQPKSDETKQKQTDDQHNEKGESDSLTSDNSTKITNDSAISDSSIPVEQNKTDQPQKISKDENFHIERGSAKNLTDFQRQKAKYFFSVNLDIENKEFISWEDAEFYLLFHATAAGKEVSNGGDLENRLNRSTKALWDFIHDQIPLPDENRNKLTLEQALDTWASLVGFIDRNGHLPPVVENWIKVGFELYSTENSTDKTKSIELSAFDQLFQKMNLGRPYAIMAYKILTDHGSKTLDYDKVESFVRSLITSSNDDHESHFLMPGFFKTISSSTGNVSAPENSHEIEKSSSRESITTSSKESNVPETTSSEQRKSPSIHDNEEVKQPEKETKLDNSSGGSTSQDKKPTTQNGNNVHKHSKSSKSKPVQFGQDDDGIRQLLRFYQIDDGDFVEVSDGAAQRVVAVHPQKPPVQQVEKNSTLLQSFKAATSPTPTQPQNQNAPKPTSEQRIPQNRTRPINRVPFSANIRAPPTMHPGHQQAQPTARTPPGPSATPQQTGQPERKVKQQGPRGSNERIRQISEADQQRVVESVIQQLKPVIQKRVSEELRRLESGENLAADDDNDDDGFIPFPFFFPGSVPIFAGGPPHPARPSEPPKPSAASEHREQIPRQPMGIDGFPAGAAGFLPPPLLMAMMNDLARVVGEGPIPDFPAGPEGPVGLEGFMMFVNGEPIVPGGPQGFPPSF